MRGLERPSSEALAPPCERSEFVISPWLRVVHKFSIVSNPEFLSEGTAINDLQNPDRVLIGGEEEDSINIIKEIYKNWIRKILVYYYDRQYIFPQKQGKLDLQKHISNQENLSFWTKKQLVFCFVL